MARELQKYQLVERSITKKYRHELWNAFVQGAKEYRLIQDNDIVLVRLDGSAQSVLCAKLLQHLKRISDTQFDIIFVSDDDYSDMNIPISDSIGDYTKVVSFECMSDVTEQTLHSVLCEGEIKSFLPMEDNIIRPLFCINRRDISAFVRYNNLDYPVTMSRYADTEALLGELEKKDKGIEHSIFKSVHSLSLDTMCGYTTNGESHSFLDNY